MAKITVNGTIPVTPPPTTVTMELSYEEASFIRDLLGGTVTGSTVNSRRKIGDSLYYAFVDAGMTYYDQVIRDFEGNVFFRDKF